MERSDARPRTVFVPSDNALGGISVIFTNLGWCTLPQCRLVANMLALILISTWVADCCFYRINGWITAEQSSCPAGSKMLNVLTNPERCIGGICYTEVVWCGHCPGYLEKLH